MEINTKKDRSAIRKAVLIILMIILAIFFVFGLIGRALQVAYKNAGKKVDKFMSKFIVTKVVTNEKDFKRIANFKSRNRFVKMVIPAVIIFILLFITWIICMSINGWRESTLLVFFKMLYPWEGLPRYVLPFGFDFSQVTCNFPQLNEWFNLYSLIFSLIFIVTLLYYLANVGAFMARKRRIRKLANQMFSKNLDNVDLSTFLTPNNTPIIPQETTTQIQPQNQ